MIVLAVEMGHHGHEFCVAVARTVFAAAWLATKSDFAAVETVFAATKTVFATAMTGFATAKTVLAAAKTVFATAMTVFAVAMTVFAAAKTVFAAAKTLFAAAKTIFAAAKIERKQKGGIQKGGYMNFAYPKGIRFFIIFLWDGGPRQPTLFTIYPPAPRNC